MMKKVNDEDLVVISGGASIDHVTPKADGDFPNVSIQPVPPVPPPGGPGPGAEAEGNSSGGYQDLSK